MCFHTDFKIKKLSKTILADISLPGMKPGEKDVLENNWEIIPRTPPVNLLGCNIIKVQHYLMVSWAGARGAKCREQLKLSF